MTQSPFLALATRGWLAAEGPAFRDRLPGPAMRAHLAAWPKGQARLLFRLNHARGDDIGHRVPKARAARAGEAGKGRAHRRTVNPEPARPAAGSIEVGHIALAPALQRTPAATEAMALMMGWAFAAGYRRYEWKCDALNLASRRAAQRLGLSYEGTFRQAAVIKGRNRDTAWFAAIDTEWPRLSTAFDRWLAAENFDPAGRQKQSLSALTAPILAARDPAL